MGKIEKIDLDKLFYPYKVGSLTKEKDIEVITIINKINEIIDYISEKGKKR